MTEAIVPTAKATIGQNGAVSLKQKVVLVLALALRAPTAAIAITTTIKLFPTHPRTVCFIRTVPWALLLPYKTFRKLSTTG